MRNYIAKKLENLRKKGITTLKEISDIVTITNAGNPLDCMEENEILKLGHISFKYEAKRNFIESIDVIFEVVAENKIQITGIERF